MLDSAKLRHRVIIQELVNILDTSGDPIQNQSDGSIAQEWVDVSEVWAAIEPVSGREFIQSQATQSQITARITIRFRAISAANRLFHAYTGKVYNIHAVLTDKDSGLEYLTLPVSEGVSDSGQ